MARITNIRCDGCKYDLKHTEERRYVRVEGLEDGCMDLCSTCWRKMLAAVGRSRIPEDGEGDIDEYGNETKSRTR